MERVLGPWRRGWCLGECQLQACIQFLFVMVSSYIGEYVVGYAYMATGEVFKDPRRKDQTSRILDRS
jgi:hypothetical protein